jgi:hypothetical protein
MLCSASKQAVPPKRRCYEEMRERCSKMERMVEELMRKGNVGCLCHRGMVHGDDDERTSSLPMVWLQYEPSTS